MFIRNSRVASKRCVKSIKIYAFFLLHSFVFYWNRILETKCNQRSGSLWTFCGDNSSLKIRINFRKKYMFRLTSFYATFQCGRYTIFRKIRKKKFAPQNIKKLPSKVAHNPTRPTVIIPACFCFVQLRQFYILKFSHPWSCQTLHDEKISSG